MFYSELQGLPYRAFAVILTTQNKHAAEKKQRQVINKLVRGAEMKKDEAKKALEQLNIPEQKTKRNTRVEHDYAALSATTFRNKKVVEQITPETPVATIKKAESKPKIKKNCRKYNYTRADNNKRTTTAINKS